ncbi:MAG TPA: hypothetical protein VMR21_12160 [Vicinamibacteria bacterium]|nr:hypothetical protein [Vicinamibacteria bacterium]
MTRAATLVVIGVWIGLLAASWAMATASFRTVDRVLGPGLRPELQARLAPLAPDDRRLVLRHVASEANRWMFRTWAMAELALAVVLVLLAWPLGGAARALALAAAVVVAVQAFGLGPAILGLGRSLDFVPRPLPPATGRRFGLLHAGYMFADVAKLLALAAAAWIIARRGT